MNKLDINTIDNIAASWSERLRATNSDTHLQEEFEEWVNAHPLHQTAYSRIENARAKIQEVAASPEVLNLRNETLARVAGTHPRLFRMANIAVAASIILSAILMIWSYNQAITKDEISVAALSSQPDYRTAIGERLVATLEDRSLLTLNTDSSATVTFSPHERLVALNSGQAMFEVAKDAARPFIVIANGRRITAVGTAFGVRLTDENIAVTLLEGQVRVEPVNADEETQWVQTELEAGQHLITTQNAPPIVQQADVQRLLSWRHGQVIFENESLPEAVAEMNRYVQRKIEFDDERLKDLKISGAFKAGQIDVFVEALTAYFPVMVKDTSDASIILAWQK